MGVFFKYLPCHNGVAYDNLTQKQVNTINLNEEEVI